MNELEEVQEYLRSSDERLAKRIIDRNKWLIISICNSKEFSRRKAYQDDLFQSGLLGLFEAVKRFDPEKSKGWKTYKSLWIRKNMQNFVKSFCSYNENSFEGLGNYDRPVFQDDTYLLKEISDSLSLREEETLNKIINGSSVGSRDKRNLKNTIKKLF